MKAKDLLLSFLITAVTCFVVSSLVLYLIEGRFVWEKSIVITVAVGIAVPLFTYTFRKRK